MKRILLPGTPPVAIDVPDTEETSTLTSLSKLIFGALLATGILLTVPIVHGLELFAIGFVIPVVFLTAIGLVGEATVDIFSNRRKIGYDLRSRIDSWRMKMRRDSTPDFSPDDPTES